MNPQPNENPMNRLYLIAWLDLLTNRIAGFQILSEPNPNASATRYPVVVLDVRESEKSSAAEKIRRVIRDDALLMENPMVRALVGVSE